MGLDQIKKFLNEVKERERWSVWRDVDEWQPDLRSDTRLNGVPHAIEMQTSSENWLGWGSNLTVSFNNLFKSYFDARLNFLIKRNWISLVKSRARWPSLIYINLRFFLYDPLFSACYDITLKLSVEYVSIGNRYVLIINTSSIPHFKGF